MPSVRTMVAGGSAVVVQSAGARFYGWRVVAAAFTVLFVAYGLQFSFGVFVTEITDETGWSRSQILLPYAIYVALYSWLSSVSGPGSPGMLGSVIREF